MGSPVEHRGTARPAVCGGLTAGARLPGGGRFVGCIGRTLPQKADRTFGFELLQSLPARAPEPASKLHIANAGNDRQCCDRDGDCGNDQCPVVIRSHLGGVGENLA